MTASPFTQSARPLAWGAAISAGWLAAALAAGALGAFRTAPGAPPIAIGLAASAPPLAVIALAVRSARFRAWVGRLDLRFLTVLQAWRIAGFAFLPLAALAALPAGFAVPAGVGDV